MTRERKNWIGNVEATEYASVEQSSIAGVEESAHVKRSLNRWAPCHRSGISDLGFGALRNLLVNRSSHDLCIHQGSGSGLSLQSKVTNACRVNLPSLRMRNLATAAITFVALPAIGQYSFGTVNAPSSTTLQSSVSGQGTLAESVPSGPATNEVLHLTLRNAINRALRYNLGTIESGQNVTAARGERLLALSNLLPQVSAGVTENVNQVSIATLGIKNVLQIPRVIGPYSYSSADASVSATLFNLSSIQRSRAARTAEEASKLSHQDTLDAVTLVQGRLKRKFSNSIEGGKHVEANIYRFS